MSVCVCVCVCVYIGGFCNVCMCGFCNVRVFGQLCGCLVICVIRLCIFILICY